MGLEPGRLAGGISFRQKRFLCVSAFLLTCKMNIAENVRAGSGEVLLV